LHKAKTELELHVVERTKDLKTVNERLESRVAQLDFLNTTSFDLAQLIQMEQLLPAILGTFVARFSECTASICVLENEVFRCAHATGELNYPIGKKASEQALEAFHHFAGQKPVLIENWTEDIFLSQYPWPTLSDYPCYIAIPLYADNKILAIVQIFARQEMAGTFEHEQSLIATLAAHAAICLLNALHYRELADKVRIDAELDAARSIQSLFTPQTKPLIPRIDVKGVYLPAYEVGGDYLDYFQNEFGDWVIVIADVCGKGIPAALLMTMLRSTFRVEGRKETSAKTLLCSVNDFMIQDFDDRSFVTALVLIVKKDGSSMKYSRAGHPLLVHCNALENSVCTIPVDGLALGIVSDCRKFRDMITEVEIPLVKNDSFIMYTDGLVDATCADQTTFGLNRLGTTILRCKEQKVETLIASILKDVEIFSGQAQSHDDLTMLAIRVTG
jgi:sigma-B regulation protein RsbU (phosphoserine phosphatase)